MLHTVSDGGMITLSYFDYMRNITGNDTWVQQNVCGFFPDSGAWSGAPYAIEALANGIIFHNYPLEQLDIRNMGLTWSGMYWNLPHVGPGNDTYNASQTLVLNSASGVYYGAPDFVNNFFTDLLGPQGQQYAMLTNMVANLTSQPFRYPPVNTSIFYGYGNVTGPKLNTPVRHRIATMV